MSQCKLLIAQVA